MCVCACCVIVQTHTHEVDSPPESGQALAEGAPVSPECRGTCIHMSGNTHGIGGASHLTTSLRSVFLVCMQPHLVRRSTVHIERYTKHAQLAYLEISGLKTQSAYEV